MDVSEPLLSVDGLRVEFTTERGTIHAVNDVSFTISEGETIGIVGESGCGKSVTSLALLGILARAGRVTGGTAVFAGANLLTMSDRELRRIRGKEIGMIFQDPMTSLNPVHTIGGQIREALTTHFDISTRDANIRVVELLDQVGIPSAKSRFGDYPHQFSGGMRQRVMIAMALACEPKLLIADEPTTALDVTIQAQILDLLRMLVVERGTALVMITHDLGVVAGMCERVNVMYAGTIVETGTADERLRPAASPVHARAPPERPATRRGSTARASPDSGSAAKHAEPSDRMSVRPPLPIPRRHLRPGTARTPATGIGAEGRVLQPG